MNWYQRQPPRRQTRELYWACYNAQNRVDAHIPEPGFVSLQDVLDDVLIGTTGALGPCDFTRLAEPEADLVLAAEPTPSYRTKEE